MSIFYVSSYGKGNQKGIYICDFNEETKQLSLIEHVQTKDFPSYMIQSNGKLYVALKNESRFNDGGGVASYLMEGTALVPYSSFQSQGRSYTHLCLSPHEDYLFTANYHVGSTASFTLKEGKIINKIGAVHHHGLGPDLLKRQTGPHAHCVGITPDQKYLYSVDLGADKIVMYEFDNGVLKEREDLSQAVLPGSGPRHMIFSKDGRYCYLSNEIANSVMVYSYQEGHYTLIQVIHCVPRHFHGFSSASAIKLSPSGKHLFVSNRGHDSIVLYRVNQNNGKLSLLYMVHTAKSPRDFTLVDNRYLLVGGQDDNVIELLTFDEENEELVKTENTLSIPSPVCLVVKEEKS